MRSYAVLRQVLFCLASCLILSLCGFVVLGQDVGADVGGGAGIFRPKNPETKKRSSKPMTPVVKSSNRSAGRKTAPPPANIEDRVEELLDRGNQDRDARKFSDAEQAYQSALKLKPRDARAAYGLGNVYTDQQRWEDAETAYRNVVQWNPSDVDALVALSVVLVQPRTGASNAKRFVDAEAAARKAVAIQPNNALAWDRLGVALQSRELFNSETEHAYRRAVELDPDFAVAYAHLARVLRRLGRRDEATPLYERATTLGKDPATLNVIAESLQAEQLWDKSEPVLKRALDLDAHNPTSLFLMGRMMAVRKHYVEAEGYLKTATEVSPGAFQPYNLLGSVYLALNRYQDAERTYDRAVEVASPGDRRQLAGVFGFEGVGDGYLRAKQNSDAVRVYQRGLELDPGNKQLEEKLSQAKAH
jgi:tetratricopeptide (TPR) repeat protein